MMHTATINTLEDQESSRGLAIVRRWKKSAATTPQQTTRIKDMTVSVIVGLPKRMRSNKKLDATKEIP